VNEEFPKPLRGKRVVVTRAREQSEPLMRALREQEAVPVLAPMVAFVPPDDVRELDQAIGGSERYDWLLLTSQNALRALQERCENLGIELAHRMRAVRIAVVGQATGEAANSAGLSVEYVASKHHGAGLAQELAGRIVGKRVLLPRSDRANPDLVSKLEELGANVREIIAYKTVRPEGVQLAESEKIVSEGADAVLFFSPSAVQYLHDILGEEKFHQFSRRALFAAIGPVTGEALRRINVERMVMAGDTTVAAVMAALTEYFSAKGMKLPAGAKSE
jgi:uroporphyrinogen-III synthase